MIRSKLLQRQLLANLLLFVLITVLISGFLSWRLFVELSREFELRGAAIASSIAGSSVELQLNRDVATIQSLIDQYLDPAGGVAYVYVIDENQTFIAHTFVPSIPPELAEAPLIGADPTRLSVRQQLLGAGEYLDIGAPILAGAVGQVHVGMDYAVIEARIWQALGGQLILIGLIFAGVLALEFLRVRRLAVPLDALRRGANAIGSGDLEHQIELRRDDELGALADSFNQMARRLHEAQEGLLAYQHSLEGRVAARTAELERALVELRASLDEREQLNAVVRELASPVVPVFDGVLVLPLVGQVDSARARLIAEGLLAAVERRRARYVIVDLTGVPVVDTAVARALLSLAATTRLLGAQTVLVGLRPELVQTIVALGIDLSELVTRADLQSGVSYALERLRAVQ